MSDCGKPHRFHRLVDNHQYVFICHARCWRSNSFHWRSQGVPRPAVMLCRCPMAMQLLHALVMLLLCADGQQCQLYSSHQEPECMQVIRQRLLQPKLNLAGELPQRRVLRTHTLVKAQYTKQEKVALCALLLFGFSSMRLNTTLHYCRATAIAQTFASFSKTKVLILNTSTTAV